jgi:hypothetical protein
MMPAMFFKLWYDATSGMWARLVGEMMCRSFQIPSRADVVRVAKHIVALEERVYIIEDALVNFEDGSLRVAPDQVVEGLAGLQERLAGKLDTVDTLSSILQQTEIIGDLAGRLERVEGKLNMLLGVLERIEARVDAESAWSDDGGEGKTPKEA